MSERKFISFEVLWARGWEWVMPEYDKYAFAGLWSGSEGRQHQPFIAVIPVSRYQSDTGKTERKNEQDRNTDR